MASTAMATPALARDNQWYVELEGGPMLVEDSSFDINDVNDQGTLDHDYGYDFGGLVGYDFGAFRLEAEGSWREADPDGLRLAGDNFDGDNNPAGDTNSLAFMLNGLLDFGADDGLQGFVGGGVGVARTKFDIGVDSGDGPLVDDSDTGFAWQALAGIRAPLTESIDVGLKYRFFNHDNIDLISSAGDDVSTRFRSHSILGTLTFNFGGPVEEVMAPPPPPPPAPPPPPPPPPPVAQCNKGPYIVFFDWDKSNITPEAATILDSAVTAYGSCANVPIMLAGYTDRSGTVSYNQGLSERRNASVTDYLTSRGIPGGSITSQAFGESNPRVPTADGVRELQNRRVEITYGPGSGY